jgi:hypothetical protein
LPRLALATDSMSCSRSFTSPRLVRLHERNVTMSRLDVRTQLTHTHQPQLFNLTAASELQTQGMRLRQHVGRKKGLGLGEEYMDNIEVQRRKQNPERVGAPGELGKQRHQFRKLRHEHNRSTDALAPTRKAGRARRATKNAHPQKMHTHKRLAYCG